MTTGSAVRGRLAPPPCVWHARGHADEPAARALADALHLPEVLCRVLAARGQTDPDDARVFLKPRLEQLLDPMLLKDCDRAIERIEHAIRTGETILVHGDYDVDGMCGTALFVRALGRLGARVVPFVPHRLRDGYDLGQAGVRAAASAGASLIITADCGTVAHDAVAAAGAAGIDVIVTDHHTPGDALPDAVALVNPNRPDCTYPFKGLAGAGVAFKVCEALLRARGMSVEPLWYDLDLVAVATIADLAPLVGENRVLARFGLQVLRETRKPGLRALLAESGLAGRPITGGQVSHGLAPRLNAVGRMGAAERGVRLLLTENEGDAAALAREAEEQNRLRRQVDHDTLAQAVEMLEPVYDPATHFGIVLAAQGWHPGVIGIVASRVTELLHRPAILIALDPATGRGRGSGRSIPGFDLYGAIHDCGHLLERFGGHRQAAGLDVRADRIDAFRAAFNARAQELLEANPDRLSPRLHVDVTVTLKEADAGLHRLLRHLAPFGLGNPTPLMAAYGVTLGAAPRIVGGDHARLQLVQDGATLEAIGFRMAERLGSLEAGARLDVAFHLQEDEWRGQRRLQARLADVRPAA